MIRHIGIKVGFFGKEPRVNIIQQTHRNYEFIDLSRGDPCLSTHMLINVIGRKNNKIKIKLVGSGDISIIASHGSPAFEDDYLLYTRGTSSQYDDNTLALGSMDKLLRVIRLVCAYNQLHTNNHMTLEDHCNFIQMVDGDCGHKTSKKILNQITEDINSLIIPR